MLTVSRCSVALRCAALLSPHPCGSRDRVAAADLRSSPSGRRGAPIPRAARSARRCSGSRSACVRDHVESDRSALRSEQTGRSTAIPHNRIGRIRAIRPAGVARIASKSLTSQSLTSSRRPLSRCRRCRADCSRRCRSSRCPAQRPHRHRVRGSPRCGSSGTQPRGCPHPRSGPPPRSECVQRTTRRARPGDRVVTAVDEQGRRGDVDRVVKSIAESRLATRSPATPIAPCKAASSSIRLRRNARPGASRIRSSGAMPNERGEVRSAPSSWWTTSSQ